jgi:hypothetical protein
MTAPPRPRANPALGSALDLRRSQIRTYERVMGEYGDVVRLAVGPPGVRFDLYCVFHPDGVKAVLAGSSAGYSKGNRFYRQIAQTFGRGLLTSEGELWERQRRLVQPLFTRTQTAGDGSSGRSRCSTRTPSGVPCRRWHRPRRGRPRTTAGRRAPSERCTRSSMSWSRAGGTREPRATRISSRGCCEPAIPRAASRWTSSRSATRR